jgi:hypothetical protein
MSHDDVEELLTRLDAGPQDSPDVDAAWVRFRQRQPAAGTIGLREQLTGWGNQMTHLFATPRRRQALGLISLVAVLALLFSFAPVRQAAADFLGIFRVRKFAVIPIDPTRAQQLEDLLRAQGDSIFGNKTVLREEGEPQPVANIAEAAALAGFAVRAPAALPDEALLDEITVQTGPAFRFEVERAGLEALTQAAGLQDVRLPDAETLVMEVDVPTMVAQEFRARDEEITVVQLPSPQAALPEGIDPATFAELGLRLLGMSDADAQRLAQSIDWTSTVVIPLPTDVGSSTEVTVDGVTGLLMETFANERGHGYERVLLWERDGMVYAVMGKRADARQLMLVADSLQ